MATKPIYGKKKKKKKKKERKQEKKKKKTLKILFFSTKKTFLRQGQISVFVIVAILEECCMASADMQWQF